MPPEPPTWILHSLEMLSLAPLLPHIDLMPGNVFSVLHTASLAPLPLNFNVISTLSVVAWVLFIVGNFTATHSLSPFTLSLPSLLSAFVILLKSL